MAKRYLIDTSAVIKYLNGTLPLNSLVTLDSILDQQSVISFMTEIELKAWNPPNDFEKIVYDDFVSNSKIIWLDQSIIDLTIEIRRFFKLKMPDAMIAATAIACGYTLVADNDKDFGKIKGLTCLNPSQPGFEFL